MYHVGIDLGTSSISMIAVNEDYKVVYEYETQYSYNLAKDGYSEINPNVWFEKITDAFIDMPTKIDTRKIKTINVTGQMHSLVTLDGKGEPLRDVIMWNDKRARNNIEKISEILDKNGFPTQAQSVSTGSQLANLIWLKDNESDSYKNIDKFIMPKDFIVYKLTDSIQTDYTDASTSSMYDFSSSDWSREIIDLLGLKLSIFPEIKASDCVVGAVKDSLCKKFNLDESTIVTVGVGDNAAAMYALSQNNGSESFISLGTSGVVLTPTHKNEMGIGKKIVFKRKDGSESLVAQVSLQTATNANDWFMRLIKEVDYQKIQNEIKAKDSLENTIIFVPHLLGEKYIYKNPNLKGAYIGFDITHTQSDLALATLEGIAFAIRDIFEKTKKQEHKDTIKIVGGATKSDLWMNILAKILNIEIEIYKSKVLPALGSIKLSLKKDIQSEIKVFKSCKEYQSYYEKKYAQYLKITNILNEEIYI